jgi:hypothetical protein
MEIGENVENKKNSQIQQLQQQAASSTLHTTQSQPIIFKEGGEEDDDGAKAKRKGGGRKGTKDRRVSFATSSQLAQYLEPLDPFQSFGMCKLFIFLLHYAFRVYVHIFCVCAQKLDSVVIFHCLK